MKDLKGMHTALILDPSDKFRPDHKNEAEFRNYTEDCAFIDRVRRTYMDMHTKQCVQYVNDRKALWCQFNHCRMTIMEACNALDALVDESDPDIDLPNSVHAFQTAERIRGAHPDKDWLQLTGFIHDLGKIMALYDEPQWSTVGDTFPVGCAFSPEIVFGKESFKSNPDFTHDVYSKKLGMYEENCGLDKVTMSWGHDEYMYQVLQHNTCLLPEPAFYIVRFHSFYPWHTGGDYNYLCDEKDKEMLKWVKEFNQFDLYSKSEEVPDVEALKPYYQSLIDKYIPGQLQW